MRVGGEASCKACGNSVTVPAAARELQELPRQEVSILSNDQCEHTEENLGFNWGAFFLTPLWLLFHGKPLTGVLLMLYGFISRAWGLMGVPGLFIGLIISLCIACHYGSEGNKIAMKTKGYSSLDELRSAERPWAIAGIVVGSIVVLLTVVAFAALLGEA